MNYYNEHDKKAAAWIRELIKAGMIAPGEVDERSIVDVKANELAGYTQCHFFAGIGGWSYALRLAGWADDRAVWTGSCPCQPFSSAGKGLGEKDHRHIWPEFARLISECKPATVFGEQVASKAGRAWLSGVRLNLETMGYAVGAADLCAAGVAAPHIRQRLFWVADSDESGNYERARSGEQPICEPSAGLVGMADAETSERGRAGEPRDTGRRIEEAGGSSFALRMGNTEHDGSHRSEGSATFTDCDGAYRRVHHGKVARPWDAFGIVECRDGKARRIEPGTFPLAHGIPGRVGRLRGYGNAIVPEAAAEFIRAFGV